MAGPVERKVQASTGAAAVSGLALWALGHYVFRAGVPDVVASWIYVLVPGALTFGAGYLAKHDARPDGPPVITVNATGGSADIGRQVAAAMKAYGGRRGVYVQPEVGLPEGFNPPSAALAAPSEKTLIPPAAAAAEQPPPAAAGPAEPAVPE
jgi:hypothetical protein